jgi:hypothetical protein
MDKSMLPNSRRKLLGLAAAGAVLGAVGARRTEAQQRAPQPVDPGPPGRQPQPVDPVTPIRGQQPVAPQPTFTSWVHGHSVVLERGILGDRPTKVDVMTALPTINWDGDLIDLRNSGVLVLSRIGFGARFVVFDRKKSNRPKSGTVWCHYAVPIPFTSNPSALRLWTLLISHNTPTSEQLAITNVDIWDGVVRVHQSDTIEEMASPFSMPLPLQQVNHGLGVSLLIRAENAKDTFLDIYSVGITFLV